MAIRYIEGEVPTRDSVVALYRANGWSSADQPDRLMAALAGSHHWVAAYLDDRLVGLANSISDGHLVVYYPHLIVEPAAQGRGIGRALMGLMLERYHGLHQHMLVADSKAAGFYRRLGFERAGETLPMWIYAGGDHG